MYKIYQPRCYNSETKEYNIQERFPPICISAHVQQLQNIWQYKLLLVTQSHNSMIFECFQSAHINSLLQTPGDQEAFWFPCLDVSEKPTLVISGYPFLKNDELEQPMNKKS